MGRPGSRACVSALVLTLFLVGVTVFAVRYDKAVSAQTPPSAIDRDYLPVVVLAAPVTTTSPAPTATSTPLATATPVLPVTIWPVAATPATADQSDSQAVELGVKFHADVPGLVVGVRFYKGSLNTGTHVGNLWTSTGTLLARATFAHETASGWQQVDFPTPVPIGKDATYVASYFTGVGQYAMTWSYFSFGGVDNPPLHAPRSVLGNPDGVYAYGPGPQFPTAGYYNSNYWVDVAFLPSG